MYRSQRDEAAASKKFYKQGIDPEDLKKRREESSFSIRKKKREEQMKKRRQIEPPAIPQNTDTTRFSTEEIKYQLENLPHTVALLQSADAKERFKAVVTLRKLLSIEKNPPIDEVIGSGAIPPLVAVLNQDQDANNQFEAAWALTNVASGSTEQTSILLANGGAEAFIGKIGVASSLLVKEQSVWAVGNIAGDSQSCRDYLLSLGAMEILLRETGEDVKPSLRKNVVWSISNLCRGKPAPPFDYIKPAIPVLKGLLDTIDTAIIADACWALSYISDGDDEDKINYILRQGVCPAVVRLLNHQAPSVQTPALRVIGNIVTGEEHQTQIAIESGCLPALKMMLDNNTKKGTKREVCWTLSNITAGNQDQIGAVIQSNVIDSLIQQMSESEFDVRKEAAWAIANATSSATSPQIGELVRRGCIPPLCDLVMVSDIRVVVVSLEGLENILKHGELLKQHNNHINPYAQVMERCGGLQQLEKMNGYPAPIFEKVAGLIRNYFGFAEEHAHTDTNAQSFAFEQSNTEGSNFNF